MFNSNKILLFLVLFSILCQGCKHCDMTEEIEDVTCVKPYSGFIGKKYVLKVNCYLVDGSDTKFLHKEQGCDPSIYLSPCGGDQPKEFDKKYIGKRTFGGTIVGLIPQGSEFTIYKILYMRLKSNIEIDDLLIYVHLPMQNIDALVGHRLRGKVFSDLIYFDNEYVEEAKSRLSVQK